MSLADPIAPNTTPAVIARLRAWASARGWTKSRFAVEAGLRDTTLRGFHDEDWNPTREILARLEAVVPTDWQAGDPVPVVAEDATEAGSAGEVG